LRVVVHTILTGEHLQVAGRDPAARIGGVVGHPIALVVQVVVADVGGCLLRGGEQVVAARVSREVPEPSPS
jgi:hypothetical protein